MRKFVVLLFLMIGAVSGTTLEVLQVYQPISLHGTDVDHEYQGKHIQARIFPRPMVLSGAMPENLVAAIAYSHRMPSTASYEIKECNLLTLYGIALDGEVVEKGLVVKFDLGKVKAPENVELSLRTVLELSIDALEKTLTEYHHAENAPLKVRIEIAGTTKTNASLKALSKKFEITG